MPHIVILSRFYIHNILVLEELNKRWKIDESRRFSSGNACKSELEFTCLAKHAAQVRTCYVIDRFRTNS